MVFGDSAETAGTGFGAAETTNGSAFDVPPPGAGVTTVTFVDVGLARFAAGTMAVSEVALT
jgi:hypothetical protein